jgi:hypothetical protein
MERGLCQEEDTLKGTLDDTRTTPQDGTRTTHGGHTLEDI